MTKKLLNKTTQHFLLASIIILLLSAPLFYYASHILYVVEQDEVLVFHKDDFLKHQKNFTPADIIEWNKYNRNVKILPDQRLTKDSLFTYEYFDHEFREHIAIRELRSPIEINGTKYTYVEKNNLVEMEGMVFNVALMFLFIIAFLLMSVILISKYSSKKMWEPFYDTLHQIRDFEIDKNRHPDFIPTNIEEFDTLNKSIDRLIETNTAIYKNQREFIENAAHELQTPLALFQNKIDTLMQFENISPEQSEVLNALNKDISRLNRLNKNLLLLSKIENTNILDKKPIVINDYIKKHLDFFSEQAKAKHLTIITDFTETVTIEANKGLAEVMINNLFLNAIRHNHEDGRIIITVANHAVTFMNSGASAALPDDKLFNRFAKLNPSGKGNGLGLAIVKKITDLNNWRVSYSFSNNLHSFTITF